MHIYIFRKISIVLAAMALMILSLWAKALWESKENFRIGEKFLQTEDQIRAITFFDRSLRWYTPFSPYATQSAKHLWELALHAEENGDARLALIALRTLRRGLYATRSFYSPREQIIRQCDGKILSLMTKQGQLTDQKSVPGRKRYSEPGVLWSCILEIGLMGWIGSVIGFLFFGLTRGSSTYRVSKSGAVWGFLFTISYGLWILGMMKA
jgi:hypothetical protein